MSYTEETALFSCAGEVLVGILVKPETPAEIGVVVIVGGPQYRAGSHRQFVLLSRALAQAGFAVLRFDYRGMGDSTGKPGDFTGVTADISAAIDTLLKQVPSLQKLALWGLCDGASAALIYVHETRDARVRGMCLLNPWVRSEVSLARTQVKHYYAQRLMQREFWVKLASGKVALAAAKGLARSVKAFFPVSQGTTATHNALSFQQKMASGWSHQSIKIFLVLSGDDYTAKEFLQYATDDADWRDLLRRPWVSRHELQGADHTFSALPAQQRVERLTLELCRSLSANPT